MPHSEDATPLKAGNKTPRRDKRLHPKQPSKDTPQTVRLSQSTTYQNGTADEMRGVLVEELAPFILEINLDHFVANILPPLKVGIITEDAISAIKSEDESLICPKTGNWKSFPTDPAKNKEWEDDIFVHLTEICRKATIHASRLSGLEPRFILALLPHIIPGSERAGRTRPDACFIPREFEEFVKRAVETRRKKGNLDAAHVAEGQRGAAKKTRKERQTFSWYDVAVPIEFKKHNDNTSRDDNNWKQVFNQQQIMALDASRRFTFGFTIENTSMRMWFCSRGIFVVSTPFDFMKETNLLLHVFLAFAFATREELRWDPTMQSFTASDGTRQYRIDVDGKTYITERQLSEVAADTLLSRATRVWIVRLADSELRFVLKDVWVEDGRGLEHEIYEDILCDIEKEYGKVVRNEVASHLLTPVAHWLVPVHGETDHTTNVMMRGYKQGVGPPRAGDTETRSSEKRGAKRTPKPKKAEYSPPRKHYRVVFKEAAQVLYAVGSLSDFFLVLKDSAKVLKRIHGCGWVHRDLGVGNLYIFNGRGLIGDLEYAKRKDCMITHVIRTIRTDFMAVEVALGEYRSDSFPDSFAMALVDELRDQRNPASPPFSHNDLHDMESLWWIAVYELFFECDKSEPENSDSDDDERQQNARALFPRTGATGERIQFLLTWKEFERKLEWIYTGLYTSLGHIKDVLDGLRGILVERYMLFEAEFPIVRTDRFEGIQELFETRFNDCLKLSNGIELAPYKMTKFQHLLPNDTGGRPDNSLVDSDQPCSGSSNSQPQPETNVSIIATKRIFESPESDHARRGGKRKLNDNDDHDCSGDLPPTRIARYEDNEQELVS